MTAFIASVIIFVATLAANPTTPLIQDIPEKKIVTHRPYHLTGKLTIGDLTFAYGSGGRGASIPYGDHKITPDDVGPWGKRHKAIGLAGGSIDDPQLGREREGIEIHGADDLESAGCVVVMEEHFKTLKSAIFAMIEKAGQAFLHIHPDGASITPEQTFESAFLYVPEKEPVKTAEHHGKRRHYAERRSGHPRIVQSHHRHYVHRTHYARS